MSIIVDFTSLDLTFTSPCNPSEKDKNLADFLEKI